MGVRQLLGRSAARRAHVLLVGVPGRWHLQATFDARLRARGWVLAASPADADVLAVCGTPGPALSEAIDLVWQQLPGPRVRVDIHAIDTIDDTLDDAAARLADVGEQRRDALDRDDQATAGAGDGGHGDHGSMGHEDMDHGSMDHEHMDHEHMDHEHMDHGSMAPAGIALAEGGDDRDELEMDVLHVTLGPVLKYWPAGVVVRCTLQGDVVTEAHAHLLDADDVAPQPASLDTTQQAARQCDVIADLLDLAGWPAPAQRARDCRDALLMNPEDADVVAALRTVRRTVRRSAILRWSLRDLGARAARGDRSAEGDIYDRLLRRIDYVCELIDPESTSEPTPPMPTGLEAVGGLITGLDLATARLVIAGLGIDPAALLPGGAHPGGEVEDRDG